MGSDEQFDWTLSMRQIERKYSDMVIVDEPISSITVVHPIKETGKELRERTRLFSKEEIEEVVAWQLSDEPENFHIDEPTAPLTKAKEFCINHAGERFTIGKGKVVWEEINQVSHSSYRISRIIRANEKTKASFLDACWRHAYIKPEAVINVVPTASTK